MSINTITRTSFEHNYYDSKVVGGGVHAEYVYHNVDFYNDIVIDGKEFNAVYQTGCSYLHNDYSCPSDYLSLSRGGGADDLLMLVWDIAANELDPDSEFFISNQDAEYLIEEAQEYCDSIETLDDIIKIYHSLVENEKAAEEAFKSLDLSDDVEDYQE